MTDDRPSNSKPFFERSLKFGIVQKISATQDRVRVARFKDSLFAGSFLFRLEDIPTLERALSLAKTNFGDPKIVGEVPMHPGGVIELAAGGGCVLMRKRWDNGKLGLNARLERGAEIAAFTEAIEYLKNVTTNVARKEEVA